MQRLKIPQRPLLTVPQLLVLALIIAGMVIALDLNRRAHARTIAGIGEAELETQIEAAQQYHSQLQATRAYVNDDDYVKDFARNEGGYILPGEKRVVPLFVNSPPEAVINNTTAPDLAQFSAPWQAWFRLLSDAPLPTFK